MKKFGTPIGAAPGSANENVGFAAVGTPPLPVGFGAAAFLVVVVVLVPVVLEPVFCTPPRCDDGCCDLAGAVVFGGRCDEELDVDVELEDDDDDEEDVVVDEDDVAADVVVVGAGVVVVDELGVHETPTSLPPSGSWTEVGGVPGGTGSVIVCPVGSRTEITQESAEATGSIAMPCPTRTELAVASRIVSFRRLNTLA